jgi:putative nucleotidyltransferase with HDIG domain
MTVALVILALTVVIVVCTVVVVRSGSGAIKPEQYLDSPSWTGLMVAGRPVTDLTAPAGPPRVPPGARVRAESKSHESERLVDEVVRGLERIPPLPHVLFKILGELDNAGSTAKSLGSIVSTEPVLTAALLRVANSASTGLRQRVLSIDEAVAYLGYSTVRSLVLRMKLAELTPQRARNGYDSEKLWAHSLVVGQVASHLAERAGGLDAGLVTTIGLLHDIGKLAINSQFPDAVPRLWQRDAAAAADESFLARERRLFGADHAFIGGFLAAQWKLPQELVDAIRLHHLPPDHGADQMPPHLLRATRVVHVANQLAKYAHVYCADMEIDIVSPQMLEELGLPTDLEALLDKGVKQVMHRAASMTGAVQA